MTLISPEELLPLLTRDDCVVVDCRFDLGDSEAGRRAWSECHVAGARYAHLDADLASPVRATGGRHPLPDAGAFARRLADWGVAPGHLVVAYDDSGGAIAGRLWWLLRDCGHERVAVLDGGFRAWQALGLPVETAPPEVVPAELRQLEFGQLPAVDAGELQHALATGARLLIDVRAAERFAGQSEPLDKVAGHIPGAKNLPLTGNLQADGRFLDAAMLRTRFEKVLGGRPANEVVVMCGSGVSACQTLVAMEHAGLAGAALYVGSWSDWISDPGRPVARL